MAVSGRPEPADVLGGEPPSFAERVLDLVARIPAGKVMTYGDVAEYLDSRAPRRVGQVLARYGAEVPWWRVLCADGQPNPSNPREARRLLRGEATPLRRDGVRVDLARARWDGS